MPGQRHRRDIHQWPASESRQGKNPRGMGAENAAHSAMEIWLMRKVRARECGVLRGGWQAAIARVYD
jgi:hypothetical protein